jgi:hypothetical protein
MVSWREILPYTVVSALAFLAGLLIERFALGGLSAPIFALTAIVAALIPIGGTITQVYYDQRRTDFAAMRQRRDEHAVKIASETLLPLCRVEFYGSEVEYSAEKQTALPLAVEISGEGYKRHIEGLRFWKYAVDHILADKEMMPRWEKLRSAAMRWNGLKFDLDRLTEGKVSKLVEQVIGPGYSAGPDWIVPPPDKWFNLFRYAAMIRQEGFLDLTFNVEIEVYRAGIGRPQTERFVARNSMIIYLGSNVEGELTKSRASEIYKRLTADQELIQGLANLRDAQQETGELLLGFRTAAWEYCQRVEASQHLDGKCDICKGFS